MNKIKIKIKIKKIKNELKKFKMCMSTKFLRELDYRLRQATGEVKASMYLLQRLSVAIQRGNSASVLGTIRKTSPSFLLSLLLCLLFG